MSDQPIDLTILRAEVVHAAGLTIGDSAHPWEFVDPTHLMEAIARATSAETKLAEIRKLHDPADWHPKGEVCVDCLDAEAVESICEETEGKS